MKASRLQVYDSISISVFIVITVLCVMRDYTILVGVIISTGLVAFFKKLTTGMYPSIFKRPNGAVDCNATNTGGCCQKLSGFPSGHMGQITVIMQLLLLRNMSNTWFINILFYIPILLVGYSRYMKKCHTLIQITIGFMLGYVIANTLYKYDNQIKEKIEEILSSIWR